MPCGLNGAVYFVEMDADGGMKNAELSGGNNKAGAKCLGGFQYGSSKRAVDSCSSCLGWPRAFY